MELYLQKGSDLLHIYTRLLGGFFGLALAGADLFSSFLVF